jgi:hypothetical protein
MNLLIAKLAMLQRQTFDAVQQAVSLNKLKSNLQVGVVIVLFGFAENYSFILQVQVQRFHWINAQSSFSSLYNLYPRTTHRQIVTH